MFSWITGPRITNVIEDLQQEPNYESTFIEPPETPAHQFAVKAFKHAIFGTPAPEETNIASKRAERKAKLLDTANAKVIDLPAPKEDTPPLSPSKQPGGILMTPGTANKGRKTVSFGSQVVDNEAKRGNVGKSGIPSDCPGKFPSPWTPGTQLKLDPSSDNRPRTKLTEALLDARTTTQPKSGQKPKARDDSDITIDLGAPRAESGKYWKEQYESYADRSEKEMKKVIAKQQLAKKFAMKKDAEVTELANKLEQERKRFRQRERDLEQQNKDFQECLRQAMADSMSSSIEIATLKARVATLERSAAKPSLELHQSQAPFHIYEDSSKEAPQRQAVVEKAPEVSFAPSLSMASSGKENASPTPRRHRRQPMSDTAARPNPSTRLGTAEGEASIILGKSPRAPMQPLDATSERPLAPLTTGLPSKSPFNARKSDPSSENAAPRSPVAALPSSPLPMPSPDPWLEAEESSIQQMDKMALPVSSGVPYSRPEWNPPPRKHRVSKSVSHTQKTEVPRLNRQNERSAATKKAEATGTSKQNTEMITREPRPTKQNLKADTNTASTKASNQREFDNPKADAPKKVEPAAHQPATDPRFDMSKITAHHAEGSLQVKRDRAEILPVDRKEQARRRLEERKKLRKNAPA